MPTNLPSPPSTDESDHKVVAIRTRRSNGKSRSGCLTCKKRRVKCDEKRPTCSRCIGQPQNCIYTATTAPSWKSNVGSFAITLAPKNKPKPSVPTSTLTLTQALKPIETHPEILITKPVYNVESFEPGYFSIDLQNIWAHHAAPSDLTLSPRISFVPERERRKLGPKDTFLLQNFTESTCWDLVGPHSLWAGDLTQLAFQHNYLLHAILMLSARHLQKVPPAPERGVQYTRHDFELLESGHLHKTLATFRPTFHPNSCESPEAIVATSFILYFHMCSILDFHPFSQPRREDTSFKYLRGICSIVTAGPGVKYKIDLFRKIIQAPTYFPYFLTEIYPVPGPGGELLRRLWCLSPEDPRRPNHESYDIYDKRISSLAPYLLKCTDPDLPTSALEELLVSFQRWQSHCPLRFDRLVKEFDPLALVILAYYYAAIGTVLARCRGGLWWWWQEKPSFMVETISVYLGLEWSEWMRWPRDMALTFRQNQKVGDNCRGIWTLPRDIYDMEKDMSYYERAQAREDQLKLESEIRARIGREEGVKVGRVAS